MQFHISDPNHDQIESLALYKINTILQQFGKSLSDYYLPDPSIVFDDIGGIPQIIAEETADDPFML